MDTGGGVGRRRRATASSIVVVRRHAHGLLVFGVWWWTVGRIRYEGVSSIVGLRLNFPAKNVELEEVRVGSCWKLEVGG
jgi:hypothetical protein